MSSLGAGGQGALRAAITAAVAAAAVAGALSLAGGTAAPRAAAQETATANASVRVVTSGMNSERVRTIPIAKRPQGKRRVVMSLGPKQLRRLRSGDRLEGKAEVEVSTTCIRPRWWRCVGRFYRFNPMVGASLVLARGPRAVRGPRATPVSPWTWLRCWQSPRRRNHHCVLTIPSAERDIADPSNLPCDPARCHLNLVMSAHHPRAKRGHRLVIGIDGRRRIIQNKGQLSAAIYRPREAQEQGALGVTTERIRRRIPMGPRRAGGARRRVIYSQRLDGLRAGEQLVVDARAIGRIRHLSYNALVQSKLVLSRRPGVARRAGAPRLVGTLQGRFGPQNGFNCTQRPSGHSDPCVVRKAGVMRIVRDARERPMSGQGERIPLYVSLVVGARAVGPRGDRRRRGHRMRIGTGGFLRVYRYGPELRRSASSPPPPSSSPPPDPLPPCRCRDRPSR